MGITPEIFLRINNSLIENKIFKGEVLEFGAQCLMGDFTKKEVVELIGANHSELGIFKHHRISDVFFSKPAYTSIGFKYSSVDCIEYEHSLKIDLNYEDIPQTFENRFDFITNLGTSEHIFNQYNCFKNMHNATKVGGLMIHGIPINGMIDHGLFNTQPNMFLALAISNKYEICECLISTGQTDYDIMSLNSYSDINFGFDAGIYIVLKKTENCIFKAAQQGNFNCSDDELNKFKFNLDKIFKLYKLSIQSIDINDVIKLVSNKKIVMYGAGGNTNASLSIPEIRKNIIAVTDKNENKWGEEIHGVKIIPPSAVSKFTKDVLVMIDAPKEDIINYLISQNGIDLDIVFLEIPSH